MSANGEKPKLLILASREAMRDPSGPLLRFVRENAYTLKKFKIHATGGTARAILSTGFYKENEEVVKYRFGPEGGVVELAAIVARRECETVIFLSDPKDLLSGVPEDHALQRVCKELNVRLITTLATAEQWARYEAAEYLKEWQSRKDGAEYHNLLRKWRPENWKEGNANVGEDGELFVFSTQQQTLALIAHDKKKEKMAVFANAHAEFLSRFHRILTTGTTGFLLKLLHAAEDGQPPTVAEVLLEAEKKLEKDRFQELKFSYWMIRLVYGEGSQREQLLSKARADVPQQFEKLKKEFQAQVEKEGTREPPRFTEAKPRFVERIMPLPSGPRGGDILIAEEVLRNRCHAVVFFQDPGTAQPHDPDIHLFERSCQYWSESPRTRRVYATCVSDSESASKWAAYMSKMKSFTLPPTPYTAHDLRRKYKLRDVVIVEDDAQPLQECLVRSCAGYFHRRLSAIMRDGKTAKVVLLAGDLPQQVISALIRMKGEEILFHGPSDSRGEIIWAVEKPAGDTGNAVLALATKYQRFYNKGIVEPTEEEALINTPDLLRNADIVLAPCEAICTALYISGLKGASENGAVITICGLSPGDEGTAHTIMNDGLISVLITNRSIAKHLSTPDRLPDP
jgi:methylglyoxal synthase